jgi:hypothetical protein
MKSKTCRKNLTRLIVYNRTAAHSPRIEHLSCGFDGITLWPGHDVVPNRQLASHSHQRKLGRGPFHLSVGTADGELRHGFERITVISAYQHPPPSIPAAHTIAFVNTARYFGSEYAED